MNNDSHAYKGTGFKAIPTAYRGIEFRSRFESEVAMLLDKMGLDWQYDPKSFLLPGGHYMPDFFVPSQCLWVESRGYDNKDWQIEQFSEHTAKMLARLLKDASKNEQKAMALGVMVGRASR